ncbi:phosphodiesterase [Stappia sp. ES.058]|uniref:phosphodiesterase n=1 Tax=Stappia sp. ES.058 TaxID=1881061 RepID=UPI00087A2B7C|nr:phosphodiesterase [Stappia sp. ES.058]SDU15713.1 3',5'-cyclic AMP phosphodiesterase CpdA [Stappia sp. ES.058]
MTLIAQITDLHIRPRGLACYRVSETNMLAERAVAALNALAPQPDAVVVTGDLADAPDEREYAGVQRILSRIKAPVFVIPGNHDSPAMMRDLLTGVGPIDQGSDSKVHYAVDIGDVRLVALDSSVPGKPHGELGSAQLAWLEHTLAESDRPTLIAIHHPPAATGIAHMDRIGLKDSDALAALLSRNSHVERIMCGHIHRTIIASVGGTVMTLAPSTGHQVHLDIADREPGRFIMEPPGFFLHHHTRGSGVVSHLAYIEAFPGPFPFFADEGVSW